jgi:hypothetical protein
VLPARRGIRRAISTARKGADGGQCSTLRRPRLAQPFEMMLDLEVGVGDRSTRLMNPQLARRRPEEAHVD